MKIIGLMPARNEEWILGFSARVALTWCDELIIRVHASTDRTQQIAEQIAEEIPERHGRSRLCILTDNGFEWDEMRHRQEMLEQARSHGATHIAIIDGDEILSANLLPASPGIREWRIREWIESLPDGHILELPGYNLRSGIDRYHANGIWGNRWFSVAFKDQPELHWTGDQFHHRAPFGQTLTPWRPIEQGNGGILHFWGANERRLAAKHAWYKLTELLRWPDKPVDQIDRQYNMAVTPEAAPQFDQHWEYRTAPSEWLSPYRFWIERYLHLDMEPWQERACRELAAQCDPVRVKALDLFGVISFVDSDEKTRRSDPPVRREMEGAENRQSSRLDPVFTEHARSGRAHGAGRVLGGSSD